MKDYKTVLCYGDSNTFGHIPFTGGRWPFKDRWTGRLQLLLGDNYKICEEGLSGRTVNHSPKGETYLNGLDLFMPILLSHRPLDYVVLMLGTNDLKIQFKATMPEIGEGIEQLLDTVDVFLSQRPQQRPEILLIAPPLIGDDMLHSPYYSSFGSLAKDKSLDFAKCYGEIAKRRGIKFLDAAKIVTASPKDSLHLEKEEHKKLATAIYKIIIGD